MKRIDRLKLINRIGRELQSLMTFSDISVYLSGFGVDTSKETSPVNSKWVYVKDLLAHESEEIILKIADELEIEHEFNMSRGEIPKDSKFWYAGYFRLFLSHLSSFMKNTALLSKVLRKYCISGFVAHEQIEPTKEWQDEIEKALLSMDPLAAILTPGFKDSQWTDQELGYALGREVLIIPIRKGIDPYGFIAKYQGLQGDGKTISDVADLLFKIIANHPKTKSRMASILIEQCLLQAEEDSAVKLLNLLRRIESIPNRYLEKLRESTKENPLINSDKFISVLNNTLKERGIPLVSQELSFTEPEDDDLPF